MRVSTTAQSPPAVNMAPATPACFRVRGWSTARTSTTLRRFPTVWADCPQTRTKALQKKAKAATGSTTGRPAPPSRPKPPQLRAPSRLKDSSVARRGRIGPPRSQKQARLAASAI